MCANVLTVGNCLGHDLEKPRGRHGFVTDTRILSVYNRLSFGVNFLLRTYNVLPKLEFFLYLYGLLVTHLFVQRVTMDVSMTGIQII